MKRTLCMLAILFAGFVASAQTTDNGRLQAADKLLLTMDMQGQFEKTMDAMITAQLQQSPQLAEYRDVFEDFFAKYFRYDQIKEELVKVYAESFTEDELEELIAFYQSPTGKKAARLTPEISQKGMVIGQQRVQQHLPELQQMIMQKMQSK